MVGEGVEYVLTNSLIRIHSAGLRLEILSRKDNALIMTRKSTMKCFWHETVLGYFGFDRTLYGDPPRKNRKWWRELSNWRIQDIENEIS